MGLTECLKKGGNKREILNAEQKAFVQSLVDFDCQITLKVIKNKIFEKYGLNVSQQTVSKILNDFNYSLKNSSVLPERRNDEKNLICRQEF